MILFFALIFFIFPILMGLTIWGVVWSSDSNIYIQQNLRIVLYSWLLCTVLFTVYLIVNSSTDVFSELFIGTVMMTYFVFFSFLGLCLFSLPRGFYKWPDAFDFFIKIAFTLVAYIPVLNFLSAEDLSPYAYWSLMGTLAVILFNYKDLFIKYFKSADSDKEDFKNGKTDAL